MGAGNAVADVATGTGPAAEVHHVPVVRAEPAADCRGAAHPARVEADKVVGAVQGLAQRRSCVGERVDAGAARAARDDQQGAAPGGRAIADQAGHAQGEAGAVRLAVVHREGQISALLVGGAIGLSTRIPGERCR